MARQGSIRETQSFPLVRSVSPGNLRAFDWAVTNNISRKTDFRTARCVTSRTRRRMGYFYARYQEDSLPGRLF